MYVSNHCISTATLKENELQCQEQKIVWNMWKKVCSVVDVGVLFPCYACVSFLSPSLIC